MVSGLADLKPFDDDILLIVLGPGFGESVLVRWPPDGWLVIDSFNRTKRGHERHPALEALKKFDAFASAVVLTHPHADHTGGFASLLDRRKPGGLVGWWADSDTNADWFTPNAGAARRQGANEQAIAAIHRIWGEEQACRWELAGGAAPIDLDGARVEILTPLPDAVNHNISRGQPDHNEMSTAVLLTVGGCSLLLGGDLVNRRGWDSVEKAHGSLSFSKTAGFKVAHHGSEEAQHSVALGVPPPRPRVLLASPYNRGHRVPDFTDGHDVDRLLQVADRLYMSGHHGALPASSATHEVERAAFVKAPLQLGPLEVVLDSAPQDIEDCWVSARWAQDGTLKSIDRGAGSICVKP